MERLSIATGKRAHARKKKPRRASPDEVEISRSGEEAIIAFADATISTSHLRIGPRVHEMSDQAILDIFTRIPQMDYQFDDLLR